MLNNPDTAVLNTASGLQAAGAYTLAGISIAAGGLDKAGAYASALSQAYFLKKLIGFLQPLLLFALILFFPIYFVMARYQISSLVLYLGIFFAVKTLPAVFIISNYVGNQFNGAAFGGLDAMSAIDKTIFTIVTMWLPIFFGLIYLMVFSWAANASGRALETAIGGQGHGSSGLGATAGTAKLKLRKK